MLPTNNSTSAGREYIQKQEHEDLRADPKVKPPAIPE